MKGVLVQLHFVMSYVPPTFVGFTFRAKTMGRMSLSFYSTFGGC